MSKLIKFYFDFMSPPSRALWIALKIGKTTFEECPVALRKKEQYTEEYKKINRFQKVPALVDDEFHLGESVAMIRYLADKGIFSTHLYPKELEKRAKVDEYLEWQHLNLHAGCGTYFMRCWLLPMNGLAHMPSQDGVNKLVKEMENSLKLVENIWLKDSDFLSGNKLTVSDLMGASDIEQTKLCKYNVSEKFPKVSNWLARVREESNPYYDDAHKFIYGKSGM